MTREIDERDCMNGYADSIEEGSGTRNYINTLRNKITGLVDESTRQDEEIEQLRAKLADTQAKLTEWETRQVTNYDKDARIDELAKKLAEYEQRKCETCANSAGCDKQININHYCSIERGLIDE